MMIGLIGNDYVLLLTNDLKRLEVLESLALSGEREGNDVGSVLLTLANESLQILLVGNLKGHVALRTCHFKVHISAFLRRRGHVKADVGERELETDLLVGHLAGAKDWQRLGAHRHVQVHDGDTLKVNHDGQNLLSGWR